MSRSLHACMHLQHHTHQPIQHSYQAALSISANNFDPNKFKARVGEGIRHLYLASDPRVAGKFLSLYIHEVSVYVRGIDTLKEGDCVSCVCVCLCVSLCLCMCWCVQACLEWSLAISPTLIHTYQHTPHTRPLRLRVERLAVHAGVQGTVLPRERVLHRMHGRVDQGMYVLGRIDR